MTPLAIVPIRSFAGMARLAAVLSDEARADLLRRLADKAVGAAADAGAEVTVVTGDDAVAAWATRSGAAVVADPGGGLDGAAAAAVATASGRPWMVLHGDLPGVTGDDVAAVFALLGTRPVLAPSKDGGTSAVAASDDSFPFRFGPGSFHRHLAALRGDADVLVRPGLAIDIDHPSDLSAWTRQHRP